MNAIAIHSANIIAFNQAKAVLFALPVGSSAYPQAHAVCKVAEAECLRSFRAMMETRPDFHKVEAAFTAKGMAAEAQLLRMATSPVTACGR